MKRLYTQKQYKEYSDLFQKMADCDDIMEGAKIHYEIKQWLEDNNISQIAEQQMDDRMEKEFEDEVNGVKQEGKVINFPKGDTNEDHK